MSFQWPGGCGLWGPKTFFLVTSVAVTLWHVCRQRHYNACGYSPGRTLMTSGGDRKWPLIPCLLPRLVPCPSLVCGGGPSLFHSDPRQLCRRQSPTVFARDFPNIMEGRPSLATYPLLSMWRPCGRLLLYSCDVCFIHYGDNLVVGHSDLVASCLKCDGDIILGISQSQPMWLSVYSLLGTSLAWEAGLSDCWAFLVWWWWVSHSETSTSPYCWHSPTIVWWPDDRWPSWLGEALLFCLEAPVLWCCPILVML